ncbi:hypothetical protein H072_8948 [Dactylellina haptotyla CBS 200.50]|uniref:Uncharacterized protein n=1 Tax=Dactylellina haptotyla (strain CBS 200.50) TaxID=1284197 RepID=S8A8F6_DACHA|nr:hypothetical protein H072_8948 [Dactylellina haptotyla CBS 200.50]
MQGKIPQSPQRKLLIRGVETTAMSSIVKINETYNQLFEATKIRYNILRIYSINSSLGNKAFKMPNTPPAYQEEEGAPVYDEPEGGVPSYDNENYVREDWCNAPAQEEESSSAQAADDDDTWDSSGNVDQHFANVAEERGMIRDSDRDQINDLFGGNDN